MKINNNEESVIIKLSLAAHTRAPRSTTMQPTMEVQQTCMSTVASAPWEELSCWRKVNTILLGWTGFDRL